MVFGGVDGVLAVRVWSKAEGGVHVRISFQRHLDAPQKTISLTSSATTLPSASLSPARWPLMRLLSLRPRSAPGSRISEDQGLTGEGLGGRDERCVVWARYDQSRNAG